MLPFEARVLVAIWLPERQPYYITRKRHFCQVPVFGPEITSVISPARGRAGVNRRISILLTGADRVKINSGRRLNQFQSVLRGDS
jgi:hypothetical protein